MSRNEDPTLAQDLTLEMVLRDPIIDLVRAADRVDPASFETLLRVAACQISSPDATDADRLQRRRDAGVFDFDFAPFRDEGRSAMKPAIPVKPPAPLRPVTTGRGVCGCLAAW